MQSKKLNLKCERCGKTFQRYRVKNRPQKFCSRECFLMSAYHAEMAKQKMVRRDLIGDKNKSWKGEKVSYKGIHLWVRRHFGRASDAPCEKCGRTDVTMNWSNIDHKYSRERKDWKRLCKECHSQFDQEKFKSYSVPKSETHKKNLSLAMNNRPKKT